MKRSRLAIEGPGKGPLALAAAGLLVLLGGLASVGLRQAPQAEPPPTRSPAFGVSPPAAVVAVAATATAAPAPPAPAVTAPPRAPVRSRPADMPYRFMGKSAAGAETSIVLFGRGRVVTVQGPGPLDDEYVVESVFDDYLVLRHLPTGAGTFLPLAQRQTVAMPRQDPENTPRD